MEDLDTTVITTQSLMNAFKGMLKTLKTKSKDFEQKITSSVDLYCTHFRNQTKGSLIDVHEMLREKTG
jgi:hypothetical protein